MMVADFRHVGTTACSSERLRMVVKTAAFLASLQGGSDQMLLKLNCVLPW